MDTLEPKYLLEKLDVVFSSLKCAAKLNVAIGFLFKTVEEGSCRYHYAHENNTRMERSKLVATTEDLTKIKNLLTNTDVIESCTKERANTIWNFYKLSIITLFGALLKGFAMGCEDTVLPDPLLKKHSVNCFTFEQNTGKPYNDILWLFRALALHFLKNGSLEEEIFKLLNFFHKKLVALILQIFEVFL